MNGVSKEIFEKLDTDQKLVVLYEMITSQNKSNKILSATAGGIGGAITMLGYIIVKVFM